MNLLQDLQRAYQEQNWDIIKDVYKNLSGEGLSGILLTNPDPIPIVKKRGRPRKIIPNTTETTTLPAYPIISTCEESPVITACTTRRTSENSSGNNRSKKEPFKPGSFKPLWRDTGVDHANESILVDPTLGTAVKHVGQPRVDGGTNTNVSVKCFKCGAKDTVSPALAINYSDNDAANGYRCDDCLSGMKK